MLIQHPTFKLTYKSSKFYYCSDAICDNSLYQKALEHASYAFFFLGGGREGVVLSDYFSLLPCPPHSFSCGTARFPERE